MATRGTLPQYRQFGVLGLILGSVIISAATDVPLTTFKVTRVNQELTDDGYRVRVYMNGSRLPQVYQMRNYISQPTLLPLQVQEEGSYVEFYHDNNSANGSSDADLFFLHPQGYQFLQVRLTNTTVREQLVPDVEILTKGKQIRFEKDHDVDLNVSVVTDIAMVNHIYTHFLFTARSTEKGIVTVHNVNSNDVISLVGQNDTDDGVIARLRLKTSSEESVEGLLEVGISFILNCQSDEDSCLINWYSILEDVPVYRADHAGPFPNHYLGFVRGESTNELICSLHDHYICMVMCGFVGDQPSPVEFVPTDRDPGHLVSIGRSSIANGGFRAMGIVSFAKGQGNQEGEYRCSSHSGPQVLNHTIRVLVVHDARINHTASYVNPLDDGIVEVNCKGSGTPAPVLTFYDRNDTVLNDVSSDLYEIVTTHPDEHTSVGVMRILERAEANRLRYVRCKVENVIFGHHFEDSTRSLYVAQDVTTTMNPRVSYYLQQFLTTT